MENTLSLANLEDLLQSLIEGYEEAANSQSDKWEVRYNLTITYHKVPVAAMNDSELLLDSAKINYDVAYLRFSKSIRPKGGTDADWEEHLIDHHQHQFKDLRERLKEDQDWKFELYMRLLFRLTSAGLEYSELLRRLKQTKDMKVHPAEQVETKPDIIITDQMPKPLTDDEKQYKDWVDKNHDKG